MGLEDIYNFLKEHSDRQFRADEIAVELQVTSQNVRRCLKRLDEYTEIRSVFLQRQITVHDPRGGSYVAKRKGAWYYQYVQTKGLGGRKE